MWLNYLIILPCIYYVNQVLGFVKSNALESVYAPAIIAFGWESGAAAFCSIFKKRRSREISEGVLAPNGTPKAQDLMVVWTTFCRRPRDGIMTAKGTPSDLWLVGTILSLLVSQ